MVRGVGIERVSPVEIRVGARGTARLRVEGQGKGVLRVGRERRWVWGRFDETFAILLNEHREQISVTLRGIGGVSQHDVPIATVASINSPVLTSTLPRLAVRIPIPRLRQIATAHIQAPRLRSLAIAKTSDLSHKSNSNA